MIFFYLNNFSFILFYHSVWLVFELFEFRVQVCSQLVQFTRVRKRYDNHQEMGLECGWCHTQKRWLRIWKIFKKIKLRSDHGVEKLGSDYRVEKLKSDSGVESWHWIEFSATELKLNFDRWRCSWVFHISQLRFNWTE